MVGTAITASLSDLDGVDVDSVTWQWASSSDGMDPWTNISGATEASYTPVIADDGNYLRAMASYTDGHDSGKTEMAATDGAVSANSAPEFPATEDGARSVAENTAAGENIGTPVAATDADAGDTLTYTVGGTDMASFEIDSNGQITVGAGTTLDYEAQQTYSVIVTATDVEGASDTIDVTITVTDVSLGTLGDIYDANNNERIERSEAVAAVRAYFKEEISKEQTIEVIGLFFADAGN